MKYQSELINEILEVRGHVKSSLHYESECIETWIEENKGAYPKLCEYEGEWLNYMVENPIGSFPYETITANPTATVSNVVPYAYKRAILKGQTLVNILTEPITNNTFTTGIANMQNTTQLQANKKYIAFIDIANVTNEATGVYIRIHNTRPNGNGVVLPIKDEKFTVGLHKLIFTMPSSSYNEFEIMIGLVRNAEAAVTYNYAMVIEYQDGMENWDIPYFEGMQSVKMPVLTTTGKNVFDLANSGLREESAYDKSLDGYGFWSFGVQLKPNKEVTISRKNNDGYNLDLNLKIHNKNTHGGIWLIASHSQHENKSSITLTTNSDGYIWFNFSNNIDKINQILDICEYIQIEYGTVATSYEPFKSNILTVNEDVTLRSNGDVYDELNLLTGRLTQRIDENNEVLAQAIIKTVDLMATNQDGETLSKIKPIEGTMHIESSGTAINPTAVLEVPVEAITQNLNSFIEEE